MNYLLVHDPTKYFEYSSKVHCITSNDIGSVLCKRKLGIQWDVFNGRVEAQNEYDSKGFDELIRFTNCKVCLNRLKAIKITHSNT